LKFDFNSFDCCFSLQGLNFFATWKRKRKSSIFQDDHCYQTHNWGQEGWEGNILTIFW
jgi:hypothetical protein